MGESPSCRAAPTRRMDDASPVLDAMGGNGTRADARRRIQLHIHRQRGKVEIQPPRMAHERLKFVITPPRCLAATRVPAALSTWHSPGARCAWCLVGFQNGA